MDEKASPPDRKPASSADEHWEEAMARARLKRLRGKPTIRPPRGVGLHVRRVARKHLKGHGTPLTKLKDNWASIVGDRYAALCRPIKLSGAKTGQTLTLAVNPAASTLVEHASETLRQRISVSAGGAVTRLKLDQAAWSETRKAMKKPRRTLSHEERQELEAQAEKIENPALKAAIVALGQAVLTDDK